MGKTTSASMWMVAVLWEGSLEWTTALFRTLPSYPFGGATAIRADVVNPEFLAAPVQHLEGVTDRVPFLHLSRVITTFGQDHPRPLLAECPFGRDAKQGNDK